VIWYDLVYSLVTLGSEIQDMLKRVTLLSDNGPMAIDAGRHPILESVQNDIVVCIFPFSHFQLFDFLYQILSYVGHFLSFFFFDLFFFFFFFCSTSGIELFRFAAQQSLSLRSIKYGDCHGAKHVRKKFPLKLLACRLKFLMHCIFSFRIYCYLLIFP
jgi:hypothetical protein